MCVCVLCVCCVCGREIVLHTHTLVCRWCQAVELGLPLMSPDPDNAALFGSKSGNKRIFAMAEVPVPPGAHDVFEEEDFYTYFAKLIVDHLDCQRVALTIFGLVLFLLVFFDVTSLHCGFHSYAMDGS